MSAVEVPAELIERAADQIEWGTRGAHSTHHLEATDAPPALCSLGSCPVGRGLVAELRALLPQPAPTCPNCGHADRDHGDEGTHCWISGCDCPIPGAALPTVRALLAAERDSKPAPAKPRVWTAGEPEPEGVDRVRDSDDDDDRSNGDIWIKRPSGKWRLEKNILAGDGDLDLYNQPKGMQWAHLLNEYGPLTEVIADGAR